MNFMSFWSFLLLSVDEIHGAVRWYEVGRIDAVALLFFNYYRANVGDQILIGGAFAHQRAKVMVFLAEQAGAQLAVCRQTNARTVTAEGLRDRRNQADLAGSAVGKPVFPGRFAALVRNLLQRPARGNALVNIGCRPDKDATHMSVCTTGRSVCKYNC